MKKTATTENSGVMFSIQTPVLRSTFLEDCMGSIAAQTSAGWEALILVNTSDPAEREKIFSIMEKYESDKRFRVISSDSEEGTFGSRNILFNATEASYIIPLDDDDMLAPDAVELCRRALGAGGTGNKLLRAYRMEFRDGGAGSTDLKQLRELAAAAALKPEKHDILWKQALSRKIRFGTKAYLDFWQFICLPAELARSAAPEVLPEYHGIGWDIEILLSAEEQAEEIWIEEVLYFRRIHMRNELLKLSDARRVKMHNHYFEKAMKRRGMLLPLHVNEDDEVVMEETSLRELNVEFSTSCPHNCRFCPREKFRDRKGSMSREVFEEIIKKARASSIHDIFIGGRIEEPMAHPMFFDFVEYLASASGLRLNVLTNARHLDRAAIDRLIEINNRITDIRLLINLPSLDPVVYRNITGMPLEGISDNLRYLLSRLSGIQVRFQIILSKLNLSSAYQTARLLMSTGANVEMMLCHNRGGLLEDADVLDAQMYEKFGVDFTKNIPTCRYFKNIFFINWKGEFLACSSDYAGEYRLGDIFTDDFSSITSRISGLYGDNGTALCRNCTLKHVNFSLDSSEALEMFKKKHAH